MLGACPSPHTMFFLNPVGFFRKITVCPKKGHFCHIYAVLTLKGCTHKLKGYIQPYVCTHARSTRKFWKHDFVNEKCPKNCHFLCLHNQAKIRPFPPLRRHNGGAPPHLPRSESRDTFRFWVDPITIKGCAGGERARFVWVCGVGGAKHCFILTVLKNTTKHSSAFAD